MVYALNPRWGIFGWYSNDGHPPAGASEPEEQTSDRERSSSL